MLDDTWLFGLAESVIGLSLVGGRHVWFLRIFIKTNARYRWRLRMIRLIICFRLAWNYCVLWFGLNTAHVDLVRLSRRKLHPFNTDFIEKHELVAIGPFEFVLIVFDNWFVRIRGWRFTPFFSLENLLDIGHLLTLRHCWLSDVFRPVLDLGVDDRTRCWGTFVQEHLHKVCLVLLRRHCHVVASFFFSSDSQGHLVLELTGFGAFVLSLEFFALLCVHVRLRTSFNR